MAEAPEELANNRSALRTSSYYEERWQGHAPQLDGDEMIRLRQIRRVLGRLPIRRKALLDVGCGRGWLAGVLPGWEYTGIDFGGSSIAAARERHPGAHFFLHGGDGVLAENLGGRRFPCVLATEVIEHVAAPEAFVVECAQVLEPGGWLVLTTPNALLRPAYELLHGSPSQPIENWLTPDALRRFVEAAGFRVWSHEGFEFSLLNGLRRVRSWLPGSRLTLGLYQSLAAQLKAPQGGRGA